MSSMIFFQLLIRNNILEVRKDGNYSTIIPVRYQSFALYTFDMKIK